ncbi:PorP/SprF family type IX secretion system membrane protein [Subsaxibacter sp. CAU 1640]|uniref:PorP/SprF family type IX secretion system membrane protein n=1 Tax=Subsaxibacter sp. CAU 1640 TaxID=2933271 RepID=UPI00200564B5|nr:type IX secretion system membrane protein PorP/SprF [Subsaxibacter sp. CAU 1640]MCK7590693.1 PorP/SprF family type IX secretion system membrane protein [Subsaxibacter sp. CAU 1640]
MKSYLLTIALFICSIWMSYSQEEDGVVALALPIRNSLTFNQYAFNPTFSFVRQQTKFISITNKREWVQFEDAPQTHLASYSGRFAENIGAGIGLFQQNYGVLTTFGGVLNFAYNARLDRDSNLTFGLNIGAYKSGINDGRVVTNFPDPSLENIPSHFLLTVNPGINYGTAFLDFGVSVNNLALYNINSSELIEDNPEQSIQAHMMYTGYIDSSGFFDESKFTALLRSDFKKDKTVVSGIAMVTVPKGIWAQVGYNNLYGASGGLGINITKNIAIEYNFEKALGALTDFGPSHEITLAYRFENNNNYDYGGDDEVAGLISSEKRRKPVSKISKVEAEANRKLAAENRAQAKIEAEERTEKEAQAKLAAENKAKADAEARAKALEEDKARVATETKAKEEAKAKQEAKAKAQEEAARLEAEVLAKEVAEAKAKIAAENKAKAEAEAKAAAEQKAREEAQAKAEAARLAEQARVEEETRKREAAEAQAKIEAEQKAKEEAERLEAEAQAEAARLAEEARLTEENRLKAEAEAKAKEEAVQKAREEVQAKAEAERLAEEARIAEETQKREAAEAQAKLEAEQKVQEEASQLESEAEAKGNKDSQELSVVPTDELGVSMTSVEKQAEDSENRQTELLNEFRQAIAVKNQDLKDLKEENDLSDQGIFMEPKPFKSLTAENNALEALKTDLDEVIATRNERIKELERLYDERFRIIPLENDEVNLYYKNTIKRLKAEQLTAIQTKATLTSNLEQIKEATEFERKRRIKRAAYDSEEDRYQQDRAALSIIKQNTKLATTPLKTEDFDFGQEQSSNIQILKNVKNVDNGYYMIVAVHNDKDKRDDFVTKVVASGRRDIDFFYDVNTSKYYIYYQKFDSIEEANNALSSKGDRPYNTKMSIVKIEN